jgi:capsular exopolysaccharide synthesis family protein
MSGGGGSASAGVIDPVKLLQRYKWALLVASVLGLGLGIAAHFVWMKVYPFYRPKATFLVLPQIGDVSELAAPKGSTNEEMNRFMMTEARIMVSSTILSRVAEDPSLPRNAPTWASQFQKTDPNTGTLRFDSITAARELEDYVVARPLGGTNLLQLQCTYKKADEATAIVRLVREKYQTQLQDRTRVRREESTAALESGIVSLNREIAAKAAQRDKLIRDSGLDSGTEAKGVRDIKLDDINERLNELNTTVSSLTERMRGMNEQRNAPVPVFGDELEDEADKDPVIIDLRSRLESLRSVDNAYAERGWGPDHPQRKALSAQIAGSETNLQTTRRQVLERLFNSQYEQIKQGLESSQASVISLKTEQEQLQKQIVDLNQVRNQVRDLENDIEALTEERAGNQSVLNNVNQLLSIDTASRIQLQEPERVPSEAEFPKLTMLAPLGALLLTALAAGLIVVRELVDQRIKGPSDVGLIPRTRLLGFVPDAGEDPAGQGAPETAFRDRGKGVVAESFRQLRGTLAKRLGVVDHRCILVMSGMPGAGSTTVVSNMALAYATSDRKVLIIDANLRRPGQHKVMGLQEAPGLSDVLAQRRTFEDVVQATSTPNLDLLSAGTKDLRQYERLSTQGMTDLLSKARQAYDIVLVDCAPAVVGGDGLALAQRCDASILVVRAMAEKRGMVARVKNELADCPAEFLGVVVNAVKASAGGYMKSNIKAASEYSDG